MTTQEVSPEVAEAWAAYEREVKDACHAPGALARFVRSCGVEGLIEMGSDAFRCRSPIRRNKSSSNFYVYPDDRGWHDFGSGESGDMLSLVRRIWNLASYREVLDKAAEALGLQTWDERKKGISAGPAESIEIALARWSGLYVDEERVFDCMTWLANLAATLLPDVARDHLMKHYGLTEEYIVLERIGYVPFSFWELVNDPVFDCPYDRKTLLSTGWFHAFTENGVPGSGKVSPVFEDRIVFQYWKDSKARYAIARKWFGKLTEADLSPKWVNEHPWEQGKYKKLPTRSEKRPYVSPFVTNTILWNEDCLRRARGGDVWITEGITDAMILAMLGLFVISPVTIAFANHDIEHVVDLLKRVQPKRVILCNDNDVNIDRRTGQERRPGLEGAKKMASTLWSIGYRAQIAQLPRPEGVTKIDVNEYVREAMKRTA